MEQLKIVVRYANGRMVKGTTYNFSPGSDCFHVQPVDHKPGEPEVEIAVKDLKAVFVVKSLSGNPKYKDRAHFIASDRPYGLKLRVTFKDDEVLEGTCMDYDRDAPYFFLLPADPKSNNKRIMVVSAAAREVTRL